MEEYIVGIDQGTTGTLIGMMDPEGKILQRAYQEHKQYHPRPSWVEHDPQEIWSNVCSLLNQVFREMDGETDLLAGVGIANQGESVILWDGKTGQPLTNIIVWQDTRTQASMDAVLADEEATHEIRHRTGLRPDAYFSASKIRWLLKNTPGIEAVLASGDLRCGTLDTWLIWNLTEGRSYVTDVSTASRTLLFNIQTLDWDDWLLDFFEIPRTLLAKVVKTVGDFGVVTHPDISTRDIPILTSMVDQPAAMVGQGCLSPYTIKATYGTGCFINLNTGKERVLSANGLLTMVAWQREGIVTYGLDGGVFTAGAVLNWLRDKANLIEELDEIDQLCTSVPDAGGVLWIPAQVGIGAPYWERNLRGAWLGVDLATERAHLVRAALDGIALRVAQIIQAMIENGQQKIHRLRVDGGLTRNKTMMQIQTDLLGIPVEVLADHEATIKGVCSLAARYAGMWQSDDEITNRIKVAQVYHPTSTAEFRQQRLYEFDHAIAMLRDAAHD